MKGKGNAMYRKIKYNNKLINKLKTTMMIMKEEVKEEVERR